MDILTPVIIEFRKAYKDIAIYKDLLYKLVGANREKSQEMIEIIKSVLEDNTIPIPERTTDSNTFLLNLIRDAKK